MYIQHNASHKYLIFLLLVPFIIIFSYFILEGFVSLQSNRSIKELNHEIVNIKSNISNHLDTVTEQCSAKDQSVISDIKQKNIDIYKLGYLIGDDKICQSYGVANINVLHDNNKIIVIKKKILTFSLHKK